ncbi:MAG: choice-of-anchor D domain-containing protein [Deltaproteobacteria bacterium]|nr:choice-of-anchor D domain-containing protein [Deltaproteobacteria bacterium]
MKYPPLPLVAAVLLVLLVLLAPGITAVGSAEAGGPLLPANPYLSFLPQDLEPDWSYWNDHLAQRARQRQARQRQARQSSLGPPVSIDESELPGQFRRNDSPRQADPLPNFGTAAGQTSRIRISGTVLAALTDLGSVPEPNGSIPTSQTLALTAGSAITVSGEIGDGAFGDSSGDFDFFRISALAGQILEVSVRTPEPSFDLNPISGLYDASGTLLEVNDDRPTVGFLFDLDSTFTFPITADGDYLVVVGGNRPANGDNVPAMLPADPFDPSSGPGLGSQGTYHLNLGLDSPTPRDVDCFALQLEAGDVVGASLYEGARKVRLQRGSGELLVAADGRDLSGLFPDESPLPGGGNAAISYLVGETGPHSICAERPVDFDNSAYTLEIAASRPALDREPQAVRQILFLDFDGATVNPEIFGGSPGSVDLSPFADFLSDWGQTAAEESDLIDRIVASVEENLSEDLRILGGNGDFDTSGLVGTFDVEIRNSRDHPDPFGQPFVARVIFGGTTEELGILTIGIAENIDVGNFDTGGSAVVLLDLLSAPPDNPNSLNQFLTGEVGAKARLLGLGLGNIATHEAGHLLGNFHSARDEGENQIMDRGGNLPAFVGAGEDGVFGTPDDLDIDFGQDLYEPAEAFSGSQDSIDTISYALGVGGSRPILRARPRTVSFAPLTPGDTSVLPVLVSNEGNLSLAVASPQLSGPNQDEFSVDPTPPFTLAPGVSRQLLVSAAPTSNGSKSALLELGSDDPAQPTSRLPLGVQGGVPAASGAPEMHDFGVIEYGVGPQSSVLEYNISNSGLGDLVVSHLEMVGPDPTQFEVEPPPPLTLEPGSEQTLTVRFVPSGSIGALEASLVVHTNDPGSPPLTAALFGEANGPDIRFDLPFFAYGRVLVGTPRLREFRVENLGNRVLEATSAVFEGENEADFAVTGGDVPFSLAPGQTHVFEVTFTPGDLGLRSTLLQLSSNDPDESPLEITLIGEGTQPGIVLVPELYSYGPIPPGSFGSKRFRILNEGGFRLNVAVSELTGPNADQFRIAVGGAPFFVSPDSLHIIRVEFLPLTEGEKRASLVLETNDPDLPRVAIPITGLGRSAVLTVDKTCTADLESGTATCQLEATNLGTGEAFGVEVIDDLPPSLLWIADDCGAGPPVANRLTWTLGDLPGDGVPSTCTLQLSIQPNPPPLITNLAGIRSQFTPEGTFDASSSAILELRSIEEIPTLQGPGLAAIVLLLFLVAVRRLKRV